MNKITLAVAITSALVVSGSALAATDGLLGNNSTGTSIVTIIKDNAVQITNVNDLDFGTESTLAADEARLDDVCVFSSTSGYNVTVTSANGVMELDAGTATNISYSMTWSSAPVTLGTPILGLAGDSTSLNCGGGTNADFEVTLSSVDFNAADPGTYTDTLTLLVQPE